MAGMLTIDGPNFATVQRSRYVVPDKVIAAINYNLPFRHKGLLRKTSLNLFYSGYSASGYSFAYTNDMNGDGINNDMMYIPKDDSEIKFKNEADKTAFWNFVDQDSYLKNHKENTLRLMPHVHLGYIVSTFVSRKISHSRQVKPNIISN